MLPDPPAEDRGHLLQIRQPTQFDPRQLAVEVLQKMSADADGQVVLLDERVLELADPALSVEQPLPCGFCVRRQGGRHRKTGDDHVGETVPRGKAGQRCHYSSDGSSRLSNARTPERHCDHRSRTSC